MSKLRIWVTCLPRKMSWVQQMGNSYWRNGWNCFCFINQKTKQSRNIKKRTDTAQWYYCWQIRTFFLRLWRIWPGTRRRFRERFAYFNGRWTGHRKINAYSAILRIPLIKRQKNSLCFCWRIGKTAQNQSWTSEYTCWQFVYSLRNLSWKHFWNSQRPKAWFPCNW